MGEFLWLAAGTIAGVFLVVLGLKLACGSTAQYERNRSKGQLTEHDVNSMMACGRRRR